MWGEHWNWAGNGGYDEGTGDREAEVARLCAQSRSLSSEASGSGLRMVLAVTAPQSQWVIGRPSRARSRTSYSG